MHGLHHLLNFLTHAFAGSYFICDEEGTNVAVFKPEDEEPLAINNPKGGGSSADCNGSGLRRGIKPGEGAVREVAAFLLDHQHFSGVPPTAMVTCLQRKSSADITGAVSLAEAKLGSLQQFVQSDGDCEERGSSIFAVKEVRKHAFSTRFLLHDLHAMHLHQTSVTCHQICLIGHYLLCKTVRHC